MNQSDRRPGGNSESIRRLPAEFEPHDRTVICWPQRGTGLYEDLLDDARSAHALVAQAIARFEPVTMLAHPNSASDAARRCGDSVEVVPIELDDSWYRDTGPIYIDCDQQLLATDWIFNGWGDKYVPYDLDASLARRAASSAGHRVESVPMVLEGGSITSNGAGTLITTSECLMHPSRNPNMSRQQIEGTLQRVLGIEEVIWLPFGLVDDNDTDGHVDNVATWVDPRRVLVQGCDDPESADHHRLAINRRWLDQSQTSTNESIEVIEIPILPMAEIGGERVPVPYLNLYIGNGFVLVPTCGHPADPEICALIAEVFGDREVIGLEVGAVLAVGGGGIHCITQQIPRIG